MEERWTVRNSKRAHKIYCKYNQEMRATGGTVEILGEKTQTQPTNHNNKKKTKPKQHNFKQTKPKTPNLSICFISLLLHQYSLLLFFQLIPFSRNIFREGMKRKLYYLGYFPKRPCLSFPKDWFFLSLLTLLCYSIPFCGAVALSFHRHFQHINRSLTSPCILPMEWEYNLK